MFQCFCKCALRYLNFILDGLLTSILWGKAPLCTEIHFHMLPLRTFCPKLPQPSELALYLKREIYFLLRKLGNSNVNICILSFAFSFVAVICLLFQKQQFHPKYLELPFNELKVSFILLLSAHPPWSKDPQRFGK